MNLLVSASAIRSIPNTPVSVNRIRKMAVGNFIFFLLTVTVAVNLIFAESEPPSQAGGDHQNPPPPDGPNQDPDGRFFFFGYFRGCNYTATPGTTCLGCTATSRCSANNVAFVRVCRGFRRFCNGGQCSFFAPANCSASG